jgi:hypothetical protein
MVSSLYGFSVRRLSGAKCQLDAYSGSVLLIVNVASPDISLAHTATWSNCIAPIRIANSQCLAFPAMTSTIKARGHPVSVRCAPLPTTMSSFLCSTRLLPRERTSIRCIAISPQCSLLRFPLETASYLSISFEAAIFRRPQPTVNSSGISRSSSSLAAAKWLLGSLPMSPSTRMSSLGPSNGN